jgi:protease-4
MRFFKIVLATIVGQIILSILSIIFFLVIVSYFSAKSKPKIEIASESVLNLKLNYPIFDKGQNEADQILESVFDPNASIPVGLNTILKMINDAKDDNNIKGITLELSAVQAGYGKLSEIRKALENFKQSGKFVYAYAPFYYHASYYLASVADSVFMHPQGDLVLNGMTAQIGFFSETMKKIGVEMQVIRSGKFKGAVEPYTRNDLSPENKEQIQVYVNDVYNETVESISKSRKVAKAKVIKYFDEMSVRNAEGFIQSKLGDAAFYKDEFENTIRKRIGLKDDEKINYTSEQKYAKVPQKTSKSKDRIAVLYLEGSIMSGSSITGTIGSVSAVKEIEKLRKNKKIKAVVLRVNSPGGSALASDDIWKALKLLAKEKELVVSMGDVAASGGYYIASAAKTIVAEPVTITGSIGVFGLIPNVEKLLNEKMGVYLEFVGTGKNSDFGRPDKKLSDDHRAFFEGMIDRVYDTFLQRVSEGRNMSQAEVHEIAQGRVWTGIRALEAGLIDTLGGLNDAIAIAAKNAGLEDYRLSEYPRTTSFFERITSKLKDENGMTKILEQYNLNFITQLAQEIQQNASQNSVQMLMPYQLKWYAPTRN